MVNVFKYLFTMSLYEVCHVKLFQTHNHRFPQNLFETKQLQCMIKFLVLTESFGKTTTTE